MSENTKQIHLMVYTSAHAQLYRTRTNTMPPTKGNTSSKSVQTWPGAIIVQQLSDAFLSERHLVPWVRTGKRLL